MIDFDDLLETTMQILILRGGPTSGNWGHAGRAGKKGGSRRGAGFKAIGVRPRGGKKLKRKDIKRKAAKAKDTLKKDVDVVWNNVIKNSPDFAKKTSPKDFYSMLEGTRKIKGGLKAGGLSTDTLTLSQAQGLASKYEKEKGIVSKPKQASQDKKVKVVKAGKGTKVGGVKDAELVPPDEMANEYSSWHKNMSKEENAGLVRYQSGAYKELNEHLRAGAPLPDTDKEHIKNAKKALDKTSVPRDVKAFRGTPYSVYANQLGDDPSKWVGQTFTDKGFMSTSVDPGKAFGGLKAEVRVPKGAKGGFLGNLPNGEHNSEQELLLPPGQKLRILNTIMSSDGTWVQSIVTEVIP